MDALLRQLRVSLPDEIVQLTERHLQKLEQGEFQALLSSPEAESLLRIDELSNQQDGERADASTRWNDKIFSRLSELLGDRSKPERQVIFFCIGYAAFLAFLQANVTGPPLPFTPAKLLFAPSVSSNPQWLRQTRQELLQGLSLDGIAAYKLTPHVELLCLADAVMTSPAILKNVKVARWAKVRVAFMQQRILSEVSSTLQGVIYENLTLLNEGLLAEAGEPDKGFEGEFLLERAAIHVHHGQDRLARDDIERAKTDRGFEFALTGLLGKRTKFQTKDTSQLVVLARSADSAQDALSTTAELNNDSKEVAASNTKDGNSENQPDNLDLNDDTLLEAISFTPKPSTSTDIQDAASLPQSLAALNPSDQPQLQPLDSAILLALASSITNTSPQDGLTREETLPYATRVLEGGSSNWQVYTQALLVRSRIEGFKARTVERGLLQLQALVDQIIAETSEVGAKPSDEGDSGESPAATFLPRQKEGESAGVMQRLRYIFQLATPTRWDLEAELATRWVELGGFRSALDIFERLELWAEAALCWAATEREDKARTIVRRQLFHSTSGSPDDSVADDETWEGAAREPVPLDAPRLYCILGDMDQSVEMYEKAWTVSNQRYARAQRSLGRMYFSNKDFLKAADAYNKSLKANQLHQQSWFALGCALLELSSFEKAAEAFGRCVQLDDTDAESWSNLAAALLRIDPGNDDNEVANTQQPLDDDEEAAPGAAGTVSSAKARVLKNRVDALKALQRAASLKHDSYRIWENLLIVATSLSPPDYTSILSAEKRIVDLRGPIDGEKCIDVEIVERLVQHIISSADSYDPSQPGVVRMTVRFIDESVVPLITASAELWRLVSKLAIWRNKPASALEAEEKAWRAVTSQPGWEMGSETRWNEVVEATVRLCDSYESLGQRERTEGMSAGALVAKDWKFKARSAIRGIMNRGRDSWEDTEGWERLKEAQEGLKG